MASLTTPHRPLFDAGRRQAQRQKVTKKGRGKRQEKEVCESVKRRAAFTAMCADLGVLETGAQCQDRESCPQPPGNRQSGSVDPSRASFKKPVVVMSYLYRKLYRLDRANPMRSCRQDAVTVEGHDTDASWRSPVESSSSSTAQVCLNKQATQQRSARSPLAQQHPSYKNASTGHVAGKLAFQLQSAPSPLAIPPSPGIESKGSA